MSIMLSVPIPMKTLESQIRQTFNMHSHSVGMNNGATQDT